MKRHPDTLRLAAKNILMAVGGKWWWREHKETPPALRFLSFPPCLSEPSLNASYVLGKAKAKLFPYGYNPSTPLLAWSRDIALFAHKGRYFLANKKGIVYEVKTLPLITPESPYYHPLPEVLQELGLNWKVQTHYFPPVPEEILREVRLAMVVLPEKDTVEMLVEKFGEKLLEVPKGLS